MFSVLISIYQYFTSYIDQARLISTIISLACLSTLMTKSPKFPQWLVGLGAAVTLVKLSFLGMEHETASHDRGLFLLSIASALLGISFAGYAFLSKRVNITYRLRTKHEWIKGKFDSEKAR